MSKMKKLLIFSLIVTILAPFLPTNIVKAETDEERKAREDYLEKYVRAYVQEAHLQTPIQIIYNKGYPAGVNEIGSNPYYGGVYYQNEWPTSKIGSNGLKNGAGYSNKVELVCSSFTAAMLHHAWGADISIDGDIDLIRRSRL